MKYLLTIFQEKAEYKPIILAGLAFLAVILLGFYIYLLNINVIKVIALKESLARLEGFQKEYQAIEQRYLSETKKIGLDYAYELGFVENSSPKFVVKKTEVAKAKTNKGLNF
ncbi:MAG: hypothetical protein AAB926_00040 [Patescibacteria group bacterium]